MSESVYIGSVSDKEGTKRVGTCYKKIGSSCLCFKYGKLTFLTVTMTVECL